MKNVDQLEQDRELRRAVVTLVFTYEDLWGLLKSLPNSDILTIEENMIKETRSNINLQVMERSHSSVLKGCVLNSRYTVGYN